MTTNIMPVSQIATRLAQSSNHLETRAVEAVAEAAKSYHYEQKNYEEMVKATRLYFMARRKTTELIAPYIQPGRPNGDTHDTILDDFNLNKKQWNRRVRELEIVSEKMEEYFDECIAKGWNPSIAGVVRFADGSEQNRKTRREKLLFAARDFLDHEQATKAERIAALAVIDAFEVKE